MPRYVYADVTADQTRTQYWSEVELPYVDAGSFPERFAEAVASKLGDPSDSTHASVLAEKGTITFVVGPSIDGSTGVRVVGLQFVTITRTVTGTAGLAPADPS